MSLFTAEKQSPGLPPDQKSISQAPQNGFKSFWTKRTLQRTQDLPHRRPLPIYTSPLLIPHFSNKKFNSKIWKFFRVSIWNTKFVLRLEGSLSYCFCNNNNTKKPTTTRRRRKRQNFNCSPTPRNPSCVFCAVRTQVCTVCKKTDRANDVLSLSYLNLLFLSPKNLAKCQLVKFLSKKISSKGLEIVFCSIWVEFWTIFNPNDDKMNFLEANFEQFSSKIAPNGR